MTAPDLELAIAGAGRPGGRGGTVLVVHGGGGAMTVAPLVAHLAEQHHVLAPTLPGWDGTPRPHWLDDVDDVALALLDVLAERDLCDVAVVGSSLGGWVASAMAALDADAGRISRVVLLDAVGIEVPGEAMTDFFALDARGVAEHSWHDAERYYIDPASLDAAQRQRQAANLATMRVYAGQPYMHDPHLVHRLHRVRAEVLAVWGAADRICSPGYGRAYAAAFTGAPGGGARFEVVEGAGHLPHLEQPAAVAALVDPFLASAATTAATAADDAGSTR